MWEQLKEYFFVKYTFKLIAFVVALGLLPLLIIFIGLGEPPEWIEKDAHHLKGAYAVTVEQEVDLVGEPSDDELQQKALRRISEHVKEIALEQMKSAYGIEASDQEKIDAIKRFLDQSILSLPTKLVTRQDTYKDDLAFKRFGLFSIDRDDMNVWLQELYQTYNQERLQEMGL